MKRSLQPIFSIALLIALALTLTSRILLPRVGVDVVFNFGSFERRRVFNSTLLEYAAIDLSHPQMKNEIDHLLGDSLRTLERSRLVADWRRIRVRELNSKSLRATPLILESPEFSRYWLEFRRNLQRWGLAFVYQPQVMNELLPLVKDQIAIKSNDSSASSGKKYGSCAVVGNSGILLEKEFGRAIDEHDAVIRLNNARTQAFAKHVGSKTTISFVNSNILHQCSRMRSCSCHPYGSLVPIVMYLCQPIHLLDYAICSSSHQAPLIVTDPRFDVLCSRVVKYYSLKRFAEETGKHLSQWISTHDGPLFHYSSGMQAVMLAAGICEKVSIFGFGKSASAKHHYHTNQKDELRLHDYKAELDLYHDLVHDPKAIPFISDTFRFPPVTFHH